MAVGDLSPDQQSFVSQVAAGTGLAPSVVTAWVGTESGWGVNKATHNYLNVGPNEAFTSTTQAANRVIGLINATPTYADLKASVPSGAAAQVAAIGSSRWGTDGSVLSQVASQLGVAGSASSSGSAASQATTVSNPLTSWLTDPVAHAIHDLGDTLATMGIGIVFTAAAFGLIALGLMRLVGTSPKQALGMVGNAATAGSMAAKVAAV